LKFQTQQQRGRAQPSAPTNHKQVATPVTQVEEPPSPASSTSSSQHRDDATDDAERSEAPAVPSTSAVSNAQKTIPAQPLEETTKVSTSTEEVMEIDTVPPPPANENIKPNLPHTVAEEGIRTRARTRKTRATTVR
jgi:receptor expression-enhancing protein 1/2/3/4